MITESVKREIERRYCGLANKKHAGYCLLKNRLRARNFYAKILSGLI